MNNSRYHFVLFKSTGGTANLSGFVVYHLFPRYIKTICVHKTSWGAGTLFGILEVLDSDLAKQIVQWIGIAHSKFFDWKKRYGKVTEHNGAIPRDFWMEDWEKQAILNFHHANPLEGYRRLTFMLLDADVVALKLEAAREKRRERRQQLAA